MAERQLHLFRSRRQRGTVPPPPLEFSLHVMVADTLRRWATPGWLWTHLPLGEERPARIINDRRVCFAGGRLKRMGVQKGWPDFILIAPRGRCTDCGERQGTGVHFLELKRAKRGKPTDEQADFALAALAAGCAHEFADNYPDALEILKRWGAVRAGISTW